MSSENPTNSLDKTEQQTPKVGLKERAVTATQKLMDRLRGQKATARQSFEQLSEPIDQDTKQILPEEDLAANLLKDQKLTEPRFPISPDRLYHHLVVEAEENYQAEDQWKNLEDLANQGTNTASDHHFEQRKFGTQDKIRHQALLAEAKLRGVKNPDEFRKLVDFFDSIHTRREYGKGKTFNTVLSEDQKNQIREEWKKKDPGYHLDFSNAEGKTSFRVTRSVPVNVERKNIPMLVRLANSTETASSTVKFLYSKNLYFGHGLDSSETVDQISQFLSSPNANLLVSKLQSLDMLVLHATHRDGQTRSGIDSLLQLVDDTQKIEALDPATLHKINMMSKSMGRDLDPGEIDKYLDVINDPLKFDLFVNMKTHHLIPQTRHYDTPVFETLDALVKSGMAVDMITLSKLGIRPNTQLIKTYSRYGGEEKDIQADIQKTLDDFRVELQNPSIQSLLQDTDKQDYLKVITQLDSKPFVKPEDWEKLDANFDIKERLIHLTLMLKAGSPANSYYYGETQFQYLSGMAEMLIKQRPEFADVLTSEGFGAFIDKLQGIGYQLTSKDIYDPQYRYVGYERKTYQDGSALIDIYNNQTLRESLDNPVVQSTLQRILPTGPQDSFGLKSYLNFCTHPESPKIVQFSLNEKLITENNVSLQDIGLMNKCFEIQDVTGRSISEYVAYTRQLNLLQDDQLEAKDIQVLDRLSKIPPEKEALFEEILSHARKINIVPDGPISFDVAIKLESMVEMPLVQADVLTKLPPDQRDKWLDTVILYPYPIQHVIYADISRSGDITPELIRKNMVFAEIHQLIDKSPSKEIKRLETQLLDQLWRLDDPAAAFTRVQEVFEKNNLPDMGKIYRVFEIIYDTPGNSGQMSLDVSIDQIGHLSPVLKQADPKDRRAIIYQDLLRVHVDSENPSLKSYLEALSEGQGLVDKYMAQGQQTLSTEETSRLNYFLDKMDTLYVNSLLGRTVEERRKIRDGESYQSPTTAGLNLEERIKILRQNFRVKEGQNFTGRVFEMYLKPLGITSLEEALQRMSSVKEQADKRNRDFLQGGLAFKAGDRFKGVNPQFFSQIMNNGSVAKEFLGSSASSDATPFDTDTAIILEQDIVNGLKHAYESSPSQGYGDLALIVRDRGQFSQDGSREGYESFPSGVVGGRHYGIRTGFATTEIDCMLYKGDIKRLDDIKLTVAEHGFYIPIVNTDGQVLFSPEEYDKLRSNFDGLKKFSNEGVKVSTVESMVDVSPDVKNKVRQELSQVIEQIRSTEVTVTNLATTIREKIADVLQQNGIKLREKYDPSIFGAELFDTGSTGRLTSEPGSYDFDYMLLLDARDENKAGDIARQVQTMLAPISDKSHIEKDYIQVRAFGATGLGEEVADVDLGIGKRNDFTTFGSHDAVAEKLAAVKDQYGEETYYQVLGNIVLAKRLLKEGKAYKKQEDGGFGGIGTENWILANNGNILQAFKSFYDASHQDGKRVSLEEFQKRYSLFDPGINIKYQNHDNFIQVLKPNGYEAMVSTIEKYLA